MHVNAVSKPLVDVAPVAGAGESLGDVVGDLFLQAATEGLTVHTHRRSVLYDVSPVRAVALTPGCHTGYRERTGCHQRLTVYGLRFTVYGLSAL
jgi:hypothetical protein